MSNVALEERFWSKVDRRSEDECWPWKNRIGEGGYGRLSVGGRRIMAHRVAYELLRGPIPDGLVLDHTCHNRDETCPGGPTCRHRRCVNPSHLDPATRQENAPPARCNVNTRKTHCKHGHEFTPENTRATRQGGRACRACHRERQRGYYLLR